MAQRLTPAQIAAAARQRGLDPNAVLAVARQEGLGGGIGDGGHAYGPFQLNNAGGVISNQYGGRVNDQGVQDWAWSPQGVGFALDRIGQVAGGLKGRAAIGAIVNRFERPANPQREIAGAYGAYGNLPAAAAGAPPQQPAQTLAAAATQAPAPPDFRPELAAAAAAARQSPSNDLTSFYGTLGKAIQARQAAPAPQQPATTGRGRFTPTSTQLPAPVGPSVVVAAHGFLNVPYRWGGNDPQTGLDCSSFVQQTYAKIGVRIPRTTQDQFRHGAPVKLGQLQAGDAIYTEPGKNGPNHVGLYIGNGLVQESPHTGDVNKVVPLKDFLGGGLVGVRRFAK